MYTKGEVVWAKIKGFPWWPGVVAKVIEQKDNPDNLQEILVNFIGENSHARLPLDKVAKFHQNFSEYSKMKKKKLLESIEIARKIIGGETTYEAESQRLDSRSKNKGSLTVKRKREMVPFDNSDEESETIIESSASKKKERGRKSDRNSKAKTLKPTKNNSTQYSKSPVLTQSKSAMQRKTSNPPVTQSNAKTTNNNVINNTNTTTNISTISTKKELDLKNDYKGRPRKMIKVVGDESEDKKKPEPIIPNNNNITIDKMEIEKKIEISSKSVSKSQPPVPNSTKIVTNFKSIINQIIETIVNLETSALNHSTLEKSLKPLLNPAYYENVPVPEIIDKDIGKYLFTIVSLIEELERTYEKENIRSSLLTLKDYKGQLNTILNTIKAHIVSHFIEDKSYVNSFMQILIFKKEEREKERAEKEKELQKEREKERERERERERIEKERERERIEKEKEREIERERERERVEKEKIREQNLTQNRLHQKIQVEAEKTTIKIEEEYVEIEEIDSHKDNKDKEKPTKKNAHSLKLDEFKYNKFSDETKEAEKGKKKTNGEYMDEEKTKAPKLTKSSKSSIKDQSTPTTSAAISTNSNNAKQKTNPNTTTAKPNELDSKKNDDGCPGKDDVNNPSLRKKICFKMAKILQDKYNLEVKTARDLTIKIETKIRSINPDMKQEYRDKILIILRSLKFNLINPDDFIKEGTTDFTLLKEKLDEATKAKGQSGEGNGLQDSPLMDSKSTDKMNGLDDKNNAKLLTDESY